MKTMSEEGLHVIECTRCINEAVLLPRNNDIGITDEFLNSVTAKANPYATSDQSVWRIGWRTD
jgi:hypothetical protein